MTKFFFNSDEQIKGDTAFNENRYKVALEYYTKAIDRLSKYAARHQSEFHIFNDNMTYALISIICARCYDVVNQNVTPQLSNFH